MGMIARLHEIRTIIIASVIIVIIWAPLPLLPQWRPHLHRARTISPSTTCPIFTTTNGGTSTLTHEHDLALLIRELPGPPTSALGASTFAAGSSGSRDFLVHCGLREVVGLAVREAVVAKPFAQWNFGEGRGEAA
jgi:hypothetical protein